MSEVVKGRFTIDLDRARSKLGKYQLADPYAYILEFVQAAILRGSQNIHINVDSDDLKVVFDGNAFDREELHNIELAVLESCSTPFQRSRQHMAMGLLAAQSLKPARILIEGILGYRWEKRKSKASSLQELPVVAENLIHVKMPWRLAALLDHFRRRKDLREEEILLLKHCGQSSAHITLNNAVLKELVPQISSGEEIAKVEILGPNLSGWGAFLPGRPAELTLIVNGVRVETMPLELGSIPFLAVVEGRQLRTDISGASVQRDQAFEEVMTAVKEARGRSITTLAETKAQLYSQEIREELFALPEFDTKGDQESYPGCLMKCPIWKLSDGKDTTLSALQEIVDVVGYLPFSVERHLDESLEGVPGVIHCDVDMRDALRGLTGWTTKNVTRRLRQQAEARENERAWRARPCKAALTGSHWVKRAPITLEGLSGEVGIKDRLEPPLLRVIVEGCLLCELSPEEWPAGVEVSLEGPFEPLKSYDGLVHNRFSVAALLATAQVMRELYEEMAEASQPKWEGLLADFLRVASRAQPLRYLLEACLVPPDLYTEPLKEQEWDLLNTEEESPLLEVAWVKTEGEKRLSVRELQAVQQAPTLVISETQQNTIERLLGKDFLEPQADPEKKRVSFRLDSTVLREEKFLAALRTELSRVTQDLELRLGGFNLSRLVLVQGAPEKALSLIEGAVHLHRDYPLIKAALNTDVQEPRLLCLLVSVLFTAINRASTHVTDAEERELQKQLAEYLLTAPARLAAQEQGEPSGVIERICHTGVCSGWASDPAGLGLRLYFQEPAPDMTPDAVIPLDSPRKKGGHHFLYELPKAARTGDKVLIHACLVHPTKGELVELSGSPRAYAEPHKLAAKPRGEVTEVTSEGVIRGWCVDPNTPLKSPQVEFYLDGNWKEGEWIGYCKAKLTNPELEEEVGFRGAHGFEFRIPNQYRDGYRHTLHAYGFDTDKSAGNPLLSGCPKTFVLAARESLGDEAWLRAKDALENQDYEEAIEQLKQRLELGGDSIPEDEVHSWLGAAYSALEQRGNANKAYERAIKLAPSQAEHWYFSGLVKGQLGHKHKALAQFRKAVLLDADFVDARFELASRTQLPKEAIVHWESLLKHKDFKNREQALRALINLYCETGQADKAKTKLTQARQAGLEGLPSTEDIKASVAIHTTEPAELPAEAVELAPAAKEETRLFSQARMALRQGDVEGALRTFLGIKERGQFQGPPDELYSEIALANFKLSRYSEALHHYREALNYKPNCERILCHIALVHHGAGDTLAAVESFQQATDANPDSPWPLMMMGAYLVKRKRDDWAMKVLEECLRLDTKGQYRRVHITLGRLYARNGRMIEAESCLNEAEKARVGQTDLQMLREAMAKSRG